MRRVRSGWARPRLPTPPAGRRPGRLALLLAIRRAGPICVTDLALATGIRDTTVSQALRLLRATGTVSAARHGRTVRYRLDDPAVARLLDRAADA
ncbi:ArsR/SmtB family transcription factor [Kitasatospora sp. NPDC087314]|uniref:ArsR/SmtB family transcription factor n=1 Tax=Kitasatospora sp. NPDC087314 TaxID=3364068 RepID=UPI00380B0CFC